MTAGVPRPLAAAVPDPARAVALRHDVLEKTDMPREDLRPAYHWARRFTVAAQLSHGETTPAPRPGSHRLRIA